MGLAGSEDDRAALGVADRLVGQNEDAVVEADLGHAKGVGPGPNARQQLLELVLAARGDVELKAVISEASEDVLGRGDEFGFRYRNLVPESVSRLDFSQRPQSLLSGFKVVAMKPTGRA